jgi:hypothetical protein
MDMPITDYGGGNGPLEGPTGGNQGDRRATRANGWRLCPIHTATAALVLMAAPAASAAPVAASTVESAATAATAEAPLSPRLGCFIVETLHAVLVSGSGNYPNPCPSDRAAVLCLSDGRYISPRTVLVGIDSGHGCRIRRATLICVAAIIGGGEMPDPAGLRLSRRFFLSGSAAPYRSAPAP